MGILSKASKEATDSDCIVTAVFLGVGLEAGKGLQISVEEQKELPPLADLMKKINAALKSLNPKHTDVKAIIAPKWEKGSYITGGLKTVLNLDTLAEFTDDNNPKKQYVGYGAYTGMVFMKNELKYWGSTFEVTCKAPRKFGIEIKGDLTNMHKEKGSGIKGYVHGMIQAIYVAAKFNSATAKTVEVAVGDKTRKLASCFGCSSFMLAVGRQPSHIHLGQAASWVPVDPNNEFALEQLSGDRCSEDLRKEKDLGQLKSDVTRLNAMWKDKVAVWLHNGAKLDPKYIADSHKESWKQLQNFARQVNSASSDVYLDALGAYHTQDAKRINQTLADEPA